MIQLPLSGRVAENVLQNGRSWTPAGRCWTCECGFFVNFEGEIARETSVISVAEAENTHPCDVGISEPFNVQLPTGRRAGVEPAARREGGHYRAEGQAKIPWRPSAASSDLPT
jgi:hypothetical protein